MQTISRYILILIILIGVLFQTACSKRCVVNGCRVRMEHRHGDMKFKSKIRPWYAYQNPRVGRDYKRDKDPDKIPWDMPVMDEPSDQDMLVSNDTVGIPSDEFMGNDFIAEDDSMGVSGSSLVSEGQGKKKKRRNKKGKDEEEQVQQVKKDPWDIENISDEPGEEEIEPEKDNEEEIIKETEKKEEEQKKQSKEEKKKEKEEEKKKKEALDDEWGEEEEEEDDGWGF